MDRIIYKGLGIKEAFQNYVIITHYKSGKINIERISKKVFFTLEKCGFAVEG